MNAITFKKINSWDLYPRAISKKVRFKTSRYLRNYEWDTWMELTQYPNKSVSLSVEWLRVGDPHSMTRSERFDFKDDDEALPCISSSLADWDELSDALEALGVQKLGCKVTRTQDFPTEKIQVWKNQGYDFTKAYEKVGWK